MSPLFERYHRDVRCWALEEMFFQRFPELIGEISVYQVDPHETNSGSKLPAEVNAHAPFSMGEGKEEVNCADNFGAAACNFGDEGVMELFVGLPSSKSLLNLEAPMDCSHIRENGVSPLYQPPKHRCNNILTNSGNVKNRTNILRHELLFESAVSCLRLD